MTHKTVLWDHTPEMGHAGAWECKGDSPADITIITICLLWYFSSNRHGQPSLQGMEALAKGPRGRAERYSEIEEFI